MHITPNLTDAAILETAGARLARHRIAAGLTQADLAERAGIGKRTLERVEAGRGADLVTLIRVLRVLNLVDRLDLLIPELPPSPIEQLKLRGKERKRVVHPKTERAASRGRKPWTWAE
jgi:transcriptional regulator with XRE-family HTH domain